jgi:hypothetical protein
MIAGGAAACSSTSNSTIYSLRAPDVIVNAKARKRMRVVTISDTHEKHWMMTPKVPDGDLLIHAGDFCTKLRREEAEGALRDFNEWLGTLPHRHKVLGYSDWTKLWITPDSFVPAACLVDCYLRQSRDSCRKV